MKPQTLHAHEDRLLDFAYGELPPQEAQAVQSHLEGCTRCSEMLAGISGVRTVMKQLPLEPAPDAGLESLLAYAQQAARNAAAGPTPQPTWWRRWLVPMMGAAAVCAFGVVSVTVNKNLALKEEVEAQSAQAKTAEVPAPASPPSPEDAYGEAPKTRALPPAAMQKVAPQAQMAAPSTVPQATGDQGEAVAQVQERDVVQGITPPPPAPAAKLDTNSLAKEEAAQKKPFVAGLKGSRSEWSNAGAGLGFADDKAAAKDAENERANEAPSELKAKKHEGYQYDRRDAMTQSGAFDKQKPILVAEPQGAASGGAAPQQPSTPAQAQAPMADDETPAATGAVAESTAKVQGDEPSRLSLNVSTKEGRTRGSAPRKAAESASNDDFDDLFGGKTSTAKREQNAPSSAPSASSPPPPPPAAAATPMPMPSVSTGSSVRSPSKVARAEPRDSASEPSVTELSKLAMDAQRSGNRMLEAQLLRQALAAPGAGKERLGLLNRLCDAEFASGNRQQAYEACALVLEEAPSSGAAQIARSRLRKEGLEGDEAKPGAGSRGPVKAAPAEKKAADSILSQ